MFRENIYFVLILRTLSYSFTAQYDAKDIAQCDILSESDCALKEFDFLLQYFPPGGGSSSSPGCIINWQYASDSRGHMTLCTDECVADKVYNCSNKAQCVCSTKGNEFYFMHVIFV